MIASLSGRVAQIGTDTAIIDVGGVGYLVHASARTLGQMGGEGNEVRLLTHMQMREDGITLFAFLTRDEQQAFKLLTQVQGVGGRVALAILSVMPPADLATAIASEDKRAVTRADGVGPKLAQRIVSELKDKLPQLSGSAMSPVTAAVAANGKAAGATVAVAPAAGSVPVAAEVISALANLGYDRSEAHRAALRAQQVLGAEANFNDLVKASLKELAG
jgi:holliday junction DNA helicase RuvA